jgi:hypothetical protein
MDIRIATGTNCVKLANVTFPLNTLNIEEKNGENIAISGTGNGKTIFDAPWTEFKNSSNARYSDKASVLAALEAAFYGPLA